MPTSNYNSFDRWLDGIFDTTKPIVATPKNYTITVKHQNLNTPPSFEIQSVLSNRKKNAFTVVWADGTHTTVHCQPGDEWDDEKALAMCFTKKALGNKGNFNDKFNDALDNKMKIIPGGAGIVAEQECECNCDGKRDHGIHPCTKCNCKEDPKVKAEAEKFIEEVEALKKKKNAFGLSEETANELAKAAVKTNNSLKEMINALTGETEKPEKKEYKVFVKANGAIAPAGTYHDAKSTITRAKELAVDYFGRKPYYYRCWMEDDKMVIDFGSYSKFIVIQGMTPDEWIKD